jgi:predicted nucleic acid-binding Zn ribbon protein
MADPPAETCETCGAAPVEKVLFPVAVHFKGSGFYSTDYGRGSRKAAKDGGDGGSNEKKESSGGDASGATTTSTDTASSSSSSASTSD